jgi:serine/threonine protein kinase
VDRRAPYSCAWPDSLRVFDILTRSHLQSAALVTNPGPIVHRDLKPGNAFLIGSGSDDTYVKVVDFGLAQLEGDAHSVRCGIWDACVYGTRAGSEHRRFVQRLIVFSLAVVLLEMLTLEMQSLLRPLGGLRWSGLRLMELPLTGSDLTCLCRSGRQFSMRLKCPPTSDSRTRENFASPCSKHEGKVVP